MDEQEKYVLEMLDYYECPMPLRHILFMTLDDDEQDVFDRRTLHSDLTHTLGKLEEKGEIEFTWEGVVLSGQGD